MLQHLPIVLTAIGLFHLGSFQLSLINSVLILVFAYGITVIIPVAFKSYFKDSKVLLLDRPLDASSIPRTEHDKKRFATYPFNHKHANTWYQLCDAKELDNGA